MIPGIGQSTAKKIVDTRLDQALNTLNDMLNISEIEQRSL